MPKWKALASESPRRAGKGARGAGRAGATLRPARLRGSAGGAEAGGRARRAAEHGGLSAGRTGLTESGAHARSIGVERAGFAPGGALPGGKGARGARLATRQGPA